MKQFHQAAATARKQKERWFRCFVVATTSVGLGTQMLIWVPVPYGRGAALPAVPESLASCGAAASEGQRRILWRIDLVLARRWMRAVWMSCVESLPGIVLRIGSQTNSMANNANISDKRPSALRAVRQRVR